VKTAAELRAQAKWRTKNPRDYKAEYASAREERAAYTQSRIASGAHAAQLAEYRADHLDEVREADRVRQAKWRAEHKKDVPKIPLHCGARALFSQARTHAEDCGG
jgi:hypothetical protein